MDFSVILTSAAVSAVVASLFTFVSQWLERRARQKELLMKAATELAMKNLEQGVQLVKTQGGQIPPLGWLTFDYYQQLTSVMKHGLLPPDVQKDYEKWLKPAEPSHSEGGPHDLHRGAGIHPALEHRHGDG
jgi:hypothetical protein